MQIDHASDAMRNGRREVGWVADKMGLYTWSPDAPKKAVELVSNTTKPFPTGGALSFFSDAPSAGEQGYAFFASRTRSHPGGVKAAIFFHNGTDLEILAETDQDNETAATAFTDPCIAQDDTGATFVSYVALESDGRKAWILQWVGENRTEPIKVLSVDDRVGGFQCQFEKVIDLPNAPPACTRGAAGVVAATSGSRACSGLLGVRVLAPSQFELFKKPLVDTRSTTSDGSHLLTFPKTGRGGLVRGESTLVSCVYAVLNDKRETFGIYRTEDAL